jgi:isocitrate dehydrogenase
MSNPQLVIENSRNNGSHEQSFGCKDIVITGKKTIALANTHPFAAVVVARVGASALRFTPEPYKNSELQQKPVTPAYETTAPAEKIIVGVDVFLHKHQLSASIPVERLKLFATPELELQMISNRGVKV